MINYDETIIEHGKGGINYSETILDFEDGGGMEGEADAPVSPVISEGMMLGDYKVKLLHKAGAQAQVYIVECNNEQYIAKVYNRSWQPERKLRLFFADNPHPNIIRVIASGRVNNTYYEIYPYYRCGTFEDYVQDKGTPSVDFIKDFIVPSVNEGLHHLHSNNIVHCDIKPSNLYLDDSNGEWNVVIGDLGSCQMMDSDGMVRASLYGTINYSVPVKDFYGVKMFPKEYDYVSFGITLYTLYTNSHFMDGLDINERARLWDSSKVISVDDARLKGLLEGLIDVDFEKVWGYEELKRWVGTGWNSGRKRRIRKEKEKKIAPLIFGEVKGQLIRVSSIHELVKQSKDNWELAKTVFNRYDTLQFIRQFDVDMYKTMEKEIGNRNRNENIVLFRVLYTLEQSNTICYKGVTFGNLREFIERLSKGDEDALEFVTFDLLTYYMEMLDAGQEDVDRLDELVKLYRLNALGESGLIDGICRAFMGNHSLRLYGRNIDCMDAFVDCIEDKTPQEIDEIIRRDEVQAWFASMGYSKEIEQINRLYRNQ